MDKNKIAKALNLVLVQDGRAADRLHFRAEWRREGADLLDRASEFMRWYDSEADSPCPLSRFAAKKLANDLIKYYSSAGDDFICKHREDYDVLEVAIDKSYIDIIEIVKILDLLADYELV